MTRTHRTTAPTLAATTLTLAALSFSACSENQAPPAPPPPVVEVATPEVRSVTEYFNYTGTLEAVADVEIRARVRGFLQEIHFSESTDVEADQVLFTIEKSPYEVEVGRARASLARAEAAKSLAQARLARTREAFERNAASEIELIEVQAELQQAEADVLASAEDVAAAELNLSYTDVRTPIAGRVDRNYVDTGNLVGQQEATLLARVVTLDPMRVSFDVSETISLKYLSAGADGSVNEESPPVEVGLADESGFPHAGRVDFVDSVLDGSTGTLRVRALLPNPTGKLYPGLFARIRVPWEVRDDAVVIHEEAVATGLQGKYVLVVDGKNTVARRPVTLGERQDDGAIVVRNGLTPTDTYIVRGIQKARPGAPVTPRPFEPPTNNASPEDAQ